jgi:hypothetical protein
LTRQTLAFLYPPRIRGLEKVPLGFLLPFLGRGRDMVAAIYRHHSYHSHHTASLKNSEVVYRFP